MDFDDLEQSSPFLQEQVRQDEWEASNDFVDLMIQQEMDEIQQARQLEYYSDFTDYEQKELSKRVEQSKTDYVTRMDEELEKSPKITEEQKTAIKMMDKIADAHPGFDPLSLAQTGLTKTKELAGQVEEALPEQYKAIPQFVSKAADLPLDTIKGIRKGVMRTVMGIPKFVEAALHETWLTKPVAQDLKKINDTVDHWTKSRYRSSENYTYEGIDIPHVAGEVFGSFIGPAGASAAVVKATKAAGKIQKGAAFLLSEGVINSVITDKESGTLMNLFADKHEKEKLPMLLRMMHVDEDDSEFEARLKGGLEGVVTGGAFAGVIEGLKASKNTIRAIREVSVAKQINKKPNLLLDYAEQVPKGETFDDAKFKAYVFRDYMKDETDWLYNNFSNYIKDESGVINPEPIYIAIGKAIEGGATAINSAKEKLEKGMKALDKNSKEYKSANKQMTDLDIARKETEIIQNEFNVAKKEGDYAKLKTVMGKATQNKYLRTSVTKELQSSINQFNETSQFFEGLRKADPTLYKSAAHVFTPFNTKNLDQNAVSDANFLTVMAKEDSEIQDLVALVKDDTVLQKDVDKATKKYFGYQVEKMSDAQLRKEAKELVKQGGYDPKFIDELERKDLINVPTAVMTEQYLLKKGFENLGVMAQKLTNTLADGSKDSKKTLQVMTANFLESYRGMQSLSLKVAQRRSSMGAGLRLYRKDVRQKAFEALSKVEVSSNVFSNQETQIKMLEKIMSADPSEAKRLAGKINDIAIRIKNGESPNQAIFKLARGESLEKVLHNFGVYTYNNLLWGPTTLIKNAAGLMVSTGLDKLEDIAVRSFNKASYYGLENLDTKKFKDVINIIEEIDANNDSALKLIAGSQVLAGFRNVDGTLKTPKQVFKEAFSSGKSIIDPGSEKYGTAYRSMSEHDLEMLTDHHNLNDGKSVSDKQALSLFSKTILDDATEVMSDSDLWEKTKLVHSAPLRTLNATDDAFKSMVVFKKMSMYAKQKVGRQLSAMSDADFAKYKENFESNYFSDVKKEMDNIENFNEAVDHAREISLTKQYNAHSGKDFSFAGIPFAKMSNLLQNNRVLKFLYPFARISVNMADYLTQYLPAVYVPEKVPFIGGKGIALNKKVADDLSAGGYRRSKAMAKITAGVGISGFASTLYLSDILTGAGPQDTHGKYQWQQRGLKPYSLNLMGHSFPLNMADPFGKHMGFLADVHDAVARQMNDENEGFVDDIIPSLLDSSYALGNLATPEVLSNTLGILYKFANTVGGTRQQAAQALYDATSIASTGVSKVIPFSSFLRFGFKPVKAERTFEYNKDGVDYQQTAINAFKRNLNLPLIDTRTTSVKNIFNDDVYTHHVPKDIVGEAADQTIFDKIFGVFGSPTQAAKRLIRLSEKRREAIYNEIEDLALHLPSSMYKSGQLPLPKLKRNIMMSYQGIRQSVTLDNKQYNELIGYTNGYTPDGKKFMKPMKEYLNELVSKGWYKKQPSEIRSVIIRNVIKKYHKNGTAIFKQKNKQFQEDIRNKFKTSMGIE